VLLGLVAPTATAHAQPPCTGCVLELPRQRDRAVPLLVVLHGDREAPAVAAAAWRAATKDKGWALLALQVPQGDSWWTWNGDPAYIDRQVDAVAKLVPLDRTRIALAGWSGGASYLGRRAQAWPARYAGIVIHGGGMAPDETGCPSRRLPAYFLVGDRNPLHRLAIDLRAHFDGCKHEVVWDVVKGGAHDAERRALDRRKAGAILDWLAARPRTQQSRSSDGPSSTRSPLR
jgi:poly(3-hydroxybutyrate) depolymerase